MKRNVVFASHTKHNQKKMYKTHAGETVATELMAAAVGGNHGSQGQNQHDLTEEQRG